MSSHVYDVIVIGAGVSGLSGAKILVENGIDVLVLEARNRVGGRTWTVQNDQVGWVDLGGAYIGRTQNHLLRLIKEYDLKMYPVNEKQKLVYKNGFNGKRSLFNFDQMPGLGWLTMLDLNHILRLMDQMGEEIPVDRPWDAPKAEQWDMMTFREFVEANTTTKETLEFMRIFIGTCVTNEHYQSSLLWFLWYVKQCGGTRPIFSTTNGGQEFKLDGGMNQVTIRLAESVGNERIHLENAVYYIEQQESYTIVKTLYDQEYRAKYVIMATPPAVQQKIHYHPPLPSMRNQLIQRAPMGSVIKCIVYYERPFWRTKNMCGSMLFIGEDYKFPITYTLDDSKPDGSKAAIIGFIVADKARKMVSMSKGQRLQIICQSYAEAFQSDEALNPIHYEEHNWSEEQYSGGCYTMTLGPGFLTRYGPYLREPVGRIYFAGTECATEWSGYINGGIQAGERAARQVMVEMGRLDSSQVDQLEPTSLDYPPPTNVSPTLFERYAPSAKGFIRGLTITTTITTILTVALFLKRHDCRYLEHIAQLRPALK